MPNNDDDAIGCQNTKMVREIVSLLSMLDVLLKWLGSMKSTLQFVALIHHPTISYHMLRLHHP
jgi:hypothetical protein